MRPRVLRRRLILAGLGGCLAAATITTQVAKADDDTDYLQALNNSGLTVYDTGEAIATGHTICTMLQTANGNTVAAYVFTHTSWTDVPTITVAEVMVLDAVANLCPEQYHPGQAPTSGRELA